MNSALKNRLGAAWVLCLVPLAVCWQALLGKTYAYSDLIHQFWPWKELARQSFAAGRLPLWNSFDYCGYPLLGNLQSGVLYPGSLLFYLLPFGDGLNAYLFLHLMLAGTGFFLFCRALGISRGPALVASVLFQANPYFLQRLPALSSLTAAAWTPWILWGLAKPLNVPVLSLLWALQFYAGYPLESAYTVLASGLLAALWNKEAPMKRLARWLGPLLLGAALAAPVLLPGLELISRSTRVFGAPDTLSRGTLTLAYLAQWILPGLARGNKLAWMTQYFPGWLAFIAVSAYAAQGRALPRKALWALLVLGSGLALCLGLEKGLGLNFNRRPTMALSLVHLGFCALAGLALEHGFSTLAKAGDARRQFLKRLAACGLGLLVLAGLTASIFRCPGLLAMPLVFLCLALVLAWAVPKYPVPGYIGLCLVIVVELVFVAWPGMPEVSRTFYQPSASAIFLKQHQGDFRLLVSPSVQEQADVSGRNLDQALGLYAGWLQADTPAAARVRDANGYDPLAPAKVVDWLNLAAFPVFNGKPEATALLGVGTLVDWDGPPALQRVGLRKVSGSLRAVLVPDKEVQSLLDLDQAGFPGTDLATKIRRLKALSAEYTVAFQEPVPEQVELELPRRHPKGMVFLNDTYYPGWTAQVDGRGAKIRLALRAFRAVAVEAGDTRVMMSYEPESFWWGLKLAACCCLAWLAWLAFRFWGRRGFRVLGWGAGCLVFLCSCFSSNPAPYAGPGRELPRAKAMAPLWKPAGGGHPPALLTLPLGSLVPRGWLLEELRAQARGLSGRLDAVWPDVGPDSAWLGGNGEAWERGPYYLDGLLPLAWVLDDENLKAKAQRWVDWTLDHQGADGRLGPERNKDWWPRMIMLKVLAQYYEATKDPRVLPAMARHVAFHLREAETRPLKEWAYFRWQDEAGALAWYYERTGDKNAVALARVLKRGGYDWKTQFRQGEMDKVVWGRVEGWLKVHGVNVAMGLKSGAVSWRLGMDQNGLKDSQAAYSRVMALHGQPGGCFSADENLSGRDPWRGTETCAVVEQMYSLEEMLADSGDPKLADGLERLAFNALPAALSPDFTSRQYLQQANQVYVSVAGRPWTVCQSEANLFGLETEWGCCTANFHQGWPKFAARLWAATPEGGLAVLSLAPCALKTVLPGGVTVACEVESGYPFRESALIRVSPSAAAEFPLSLRIPGWAAGATVKLNGKPVEGAVAGSFLKIKRTWQMGDVLEVRLPFKPRLETWAGEVVLAGPLVFCYSPGEEWRKIRSHGEFGDWEVWPKGVWNYALEADAAGIAMEERTWDAGKSCFSLEGTPLVLKAKGRLAPEWVIRDESAGPLPANPAPTGAVENLTLVPYGAARLRICEFPAIR